MGEINTIFLDKLVEETKRVMKASASMIDSENDITRYMYPAYELMRFVHHKETRDWTARWKAAGDSVEWEGALKDRFIALKGSPIWEALGFGIGGYSDYLGNPFPPFAIGSGMGWMDVCRKDCEAQGLEVPPKPHDGQ